MIVSPLTNRTDFSAIRRPADHEQSDDRECGQRDRVEHQAEYPERLPILPAAVNGGTRCCAFSYGLELPEKDDRGGAKVSALLLSAAIRPGTPWVRRVDAKSARLAASSLIVPLR